jgi:hypothetical protein
MPASYYFGLKPIDLLDMQSTFLVRVCEHLEGIVPLLSNVLLTSGLQQKENLNASPYPNTPAVSLPRLRWSDLADDECLSLRDMFSVEDGDFTTADSTQSSCALQGSVQGTHRSISISHGHHFHHPEAWDSQSNAHDRGGCKPVHGGLDSSMQKEDTSRGLCEEMGCKFASKCGKDLDGSFFGGRWVHVLGDADCIADPTVATFFTKQIQRHSSQASDGRGLRAGLAVSDLGLKALGFVSDDSGDQSDRHAPSNADDSRDATANHPLGRICHAPEVQHIRSISPDRPMHRRLSAHSYTSSMSQAGESSILWSPTACSHGALNHRATIPFQSMKETSTDIKSGKAFCDCCHTGTHCCQPHSSSRAVGPAPTTPLQVLDSGMQQPYLSTRSCTTEVYLPRWVEDSCHNGWDNLASSTNGSALNSSEYGSTTEPSHPHGCIQAICKDARNPCVSSSTGIYRGGSQLSSMQQQTTGPGPQGVSEVQGTMGIAIPKRKPTRCGKRAYGGMAGTALPTGFGCPHVGRRPPDHSLRCRKGSGRQVQLAGTTSPAKCREWLAFPSSCAPASCAKQGSWACAAGYGRGKKCAPYGAILDAVGSHVCGSIEKDRRNIEARFRDMKMSALRGSGHVWVLPAGCGETQSAAYPLQTTSERGCRLLEAALRSPVRKPCAAALAPDTPSPCAADICTAIQSDSV